MACCSSAARAAPGRADGSSPVGAPLGPAATLRPERGFLDDPLALSPDGATLYYVVTDGATFAELRAAPLAKPEGGQLAHVLAVPGLKLTTTALLPLPEDRLLVVDTDPESGRRSGQVVSLKRKALLGQRLGPASDIVAAPIGGAPGIVAVTLPAAGATAGEYRFLALHAGTLRVLGDRRYRLGAGGLTAAGASLQVLYLTEGYQTLVGRQAGDYDRKNDIRQPDRLALLDALSGKVRKTMPVSDPTAVAELAQLMARHPGQRVFVAYDGDRGRLELVRWEGGEVTRQPLRMPRPLAVYDPATLRYQALDGEHLLLSLTVDPVNEAAVQRKKRDSDTIDLCLVRVRDGELRRLGEIPGDGRPSAWVAAGGTLVLLRKHRGFSRGGTEAELYRLALPAAEAAR